MLVLVTLSWIQDFAFGYFDLLCWLLLVIPGAAGRVTSSNQPRAEVLSFTFHAFTWKAACLTGQYSSGSAVQLTWNSEAWD